MAETPTSFTSSLQTSINSTTYVKTIFCDVNTEYLINQNPLILKNVDAVNNWIFNLITTAIGEMPFEPLFGSDIPRLLFSPATATTAQEVISSSFVAFKRWIPILTLDMNNTFCNVLQTEGQSGFFIQYAYSIVDLTDSAIYQLTLLV